MNKIQKFLEFTKRDFGFFLILLIIIIISFFILSPKISTQLFSLKRQIMLNKFISNSRVNGINPQEYWKFREFYSPGYFTFSRNEINVNLLNITQKKVGIEYDIDKINLSFLVFSSPLVNSIDSLTEQTDLNSIINLEELSNAKDIILKNKNSIIYKENSKTIKVIFLLKNEEMKKANGFFEYTDSDIKITDGKNWFNATSIKTD
ncbi:hypothetical protein KKG52_01905 [Patescibacteria group bacterium]|nr:hypothetical protein [Patescibacteria group bacterium]